MPIYNSISSRKTITKEQLDHLLERRELEQIQIFKNKVFSKQFMNETYQVREHTWSHGDKLYKLAHEHYGNRQLFWIIGLYNNKPTDAHWNYGDTVFIPINYIKLINDVEL